GGHDTIVGGGAVLAIVGGLVHPHALVDAPGGYVGADRVDDTRPVLVWDDPRERHRLLSPGPAVGVGRIDSRGLDPHPPLAPAPRPARARAVRARRPGGRRRPRLVVRTTPPASGRTPAGWRASGKELGQTWDQPSSVKPPRTTLLARVEVVAAAAGVADPEE